MSESDLSEALANLKTEDAGRLKRAQVYREISSERQRQDVKWGRQHWPHGSEQRLHYWKLVSESAKATTDLHAQNGSITWADILYEEITEAFAEPDWAKRRAELIQCAAVIVAEIEDGDLYHPLTQVSTNPGASEQNAAS